jgi:hypothetical protein
VTFPTPRKSPGSGTLADSVLRRANKVLPSAIRQTVRAQPDRNISDATFPIAFKQALTARFDTAPLVLNTDPFSLAEMILQFAEISRLDLPRK